MTVWRIEPAAGPLRGELRVPSDKSISHRAVILGGLAHGRSIVRKVLLGEDIKSTIRAMEALGARIEGDPEEIEIVGSPDPASPSKTIDCGNAGTLIRLLTGAICGRGVSCRLNGDRSLRRRPMRRIVDPLAAMGANIDTTPEGTAPLAIAAVKKLQRIEHKMAIASAQVKSAILLAGLSSANGAAVIEFEGTRDHTERMLPSFGAQLRQSGPRIEVGPCSQLNAAEIKVPADISSAAFFMAAATIVPDSDLLLREVGLNPTRTGIIDLLRRMGAKIDCINERMLGGEPVADLRVRYAPLKGITIGRAEVAGAIDEFPVLLAIAAHAQGTTVLTGAEELRHKESDRIAAMATALRAASLDAQEQPDGITITGASLAACEVDSHGDHRIAMAMATAALMATAEVTVHDCANVDTSFPHFTESCASVGWQIATI